MSYIPVYPVDPYMQGIHYKMKTEVLAEGQSRVIHLRSLPDDVTPQEICHLAMPFKKYGNVKDFLQLKSKNQALMELDNIEMARQIVTHYTQNPPNIRQRNVYVQYSNHKELKTDSSPAQQKMMQDIQALQQSEGGERHVLRVVVENMVYEVTLDVLYTIFSKFGAVLKIITFTKNNQFQALIQMADQITTETAKLSLDGQNIYTNCCTLRIDYSKLQCLNVKFNNTKSRDYTRHDLPSGDIDMMTGSLMGQNPISQSQMMPISHTQMVPSHTIQPMGYGNQGQIQQIGVNPSYQPQQNNCVLLVSNLDPERIKCYHLFILFGVYGNVVRVKILYNKKDNALLQMSDNQQAQTAMVNLNNKVLHDRQLRIVLSKHQQVQMPKDGQEAANLTQDYTNSPLHRFKKPGSKNFQNIHPPSETLHLSNIPGEILEQDLRQKFSENGTVVDFRFFQKDRRMALLQMASVDEAIRALVLLHNEKLSETNHLRVSFSRTQINQSQTTR